MICTKIAIIRGLFSLFAEYFRRIVILFTSSYWGPNLLYPIPSNTPLTMANGPN